MSSSTIKTEGVVPSIVEQGEEALGFQNADWLKTINGLEKEGELDKAATLRARHLQIVEAHNILDDSETSAVDKVKALQTMTKKK